VTRNGRVLVTLALCAVLGWGVVIGAAVGLCELVRLVAGRTTPVP
jgi:uncharacterized membrane protein